MEVVWEQYLLYDLTKDAAYNAVPGATPQRHGPARTPAPDPSDTNIFQLCTENKRLPSSRPFSPSYNEAGMKLSSIRPKPPLSGRPNQKTPNEPILPPNPYQIQPLTPDRHEPRPNPPAAPSRFPYNENCP